MSTSRKFIAITTLVAGSATVGLGDQVSFSHDSGGSVAYADYFGLQSFDVSLGTLTAVGVTFDYTDSIGFSATNFTSSSASFSASGGGFSFGFSTPDNIHQAGTESYLTGGTLAAGQIDFFNGYGSGTLAATVPTSDFSAFEAPSAGPVGFYQVVAESVNGDFPGNPAISFSDLYGGLSGTTTVTYTYNNPAAAPEPAPVAALGVGAFGLMLRKRRK